MRRTIAIAVALACLFACPAGAQTPRGLWSPGCSDYTIATVPPPADEHGHINMYICPPRHDTAPPVEVCPERPTIRKMADVDRIEAGIRARGGKLCD
jgi:hypothetical protein